MTKSIEKKDLIVEIFNAVTHGIAALLGVVAMVFLLNKGLSNSNYMTSEFLAYTIYGTSLIVLFLASTLYHSFSFSKFKNLFQKVDHASIYLLIAGTYTPYLIITVGGIVGYIFLAVVWSAALSGIIFEVVWTNRFPKLSTYLYLIMGWMGILLIYPLYQTIHINGLILLFVGGLSYSIGTIFYRMKHLNWMHIVWHLFVVGGAAFMYFSIFLYV